MERRLRKFEARSEFVVLRTLAKSVNPLPFCMVLKSSIYKYTVYIHISYIYIYWQGFPYPFLVGLASLCMVWCKHDSKTTWTQSLKELQRLVWQTAWDSPGTQMNMGIVIRFRSNSPLLDSELEASKWQLLVPHDFYPGTRTPCASCLHKSSPARHASHWVGWDCLAFALQTLHWLDENLCKQICSPNPA